MRTCQAGHAGSKGASFSSVGTGQGASRAREAVSKSNSWSGGRHRSVLARLWGYFCILQAETSLVAAGSLSFPFFHVAVFRLT